jgi:hypothetical protein
MSRIEANNYISNSVHIQEMEAKKELANIPVETNKK